jgi:O-antigen ligase
MSPRSLSTWHLAFLLIMLTSGYLSIAVSQIALGIGLILMLAGWAICRHAPARTGMEKTSALLAGWALITIPFSQDPSWSLVYYKRFYLFTAIWVAATVAATEFRRLLMAWFLFGGALIISLWGMISAMKRSGGLFHFRMHEISNPMTSGAMLMMVVLVAVGFLMVRGNSRRLKIAVAAVILPVFVGLIMTMTRSAFLGFFLGFAVILLMSRPKLFGVFAGAAALGLVLLFAFGDQVLSERMWERVNPEFLVRGGNTTTRLGMWRGGMEIVKAKPFTGVGDMGLEEISKDFYVSDDGLYYGHMHNNFVHMAVIWGVPGLVFGTLWLLAPAWLLGRRWLRLKRGPDASRAPPILKSWVLGVAGAWTGFFVAGFTEWYVGDAETMLIYLAILGVAMGPWNVSDDPTPAEA